MKISVVLVVLALAGSFFFFKKIAHQALYPAPRWAAVSAPPAPFREVIVSLSDGSSAVVWLYKSEKTEPGVIFFHGNGESLETMRMSGLLQRIGELERSFVAVDYPGYGKGSGAADEANIVEAGVKAAELLLRETGSKQVIVAGWSLGAAAAAQVAAEIAGKAAGVILLSPWSSLLDTAGDFYPAALVRILVSDRFDTVSAAARITSPVLIVHGKQDELIRAEQSEKLFRVLGSERAKRIVFENAAHNDLLARDEVWQEIAQFIASLDGRSTG